jgi:probable F420-dependent oxidoreductase
MREFISAMHAIWDSWQNGTKLDFSGDFYTHTLMTPFFDPGPNAYGAPRVFLAAVGKQMTQVAAEVGDGLLVHGFTTERYLRETTLPEVERTLAKSGKPRTAFQLCYRAFVITGTNEQELAAAEEGTRRRIAFYASTPAYRPVLEMHGWGELQSELQRLSKRQAWADMGQLISDEILDTFAVRGDAESVARQLTNRFGDVIDRIALSTPYQFNEAITETVAELRKLQ